MIASQFVKPMEELMKINSSEHFVVVAPQQKKEQETMEEMTKKENGAMIQKQRNGRKTDNEQKA